MSNSASRLPEELIEEENRKREAELKADCAALERQLKRRGIRMEEAARNLAAFRVSLPSWGLAAGGTRFGTFSLPGQPRDIAEKLADAAVVNDLTRATPCVSLHLPWDKTADPAALRREARKLGLTFDTMNSNTFQDQPGQKLSYKFGSLSHTDPRVREQAVAHNLEVLKFGKKVGARALNLWIGDGSNFPGQTSIAESFERYLASVKKIYRALPAGWSLFLEYKPFEPAFYYTVLGDWGSALLAAREVGERCRVLVDLGHHLPGTNVEAVVARLIRAGKLGGLHLNDSHYADDDLTAGSLAPYRLFRVFLELVNAERKRWNFRPAYMIDQSHNDKDPIEALCQTVMEMQALWAKALIVDWPALAEAQRKNDVVMAENCLKTAFHTDTTPLAALVRLRRGGAISPLAVFRKSGYRRKTARQRGAAF